MKTLTKDSIILTYINYFTKSGKPTLGIWGWVNTSNIHLSKLRKDYPLLDIKRRKISDIIDNNFFDEVSIKKEILEKLKTLHTN